MKKYLLLVISLFALLVPLHSAEAAEIYSGQSYFLNKDTIAPDNLLIISGRAQIAGLVKGDLIILSGDVTINGQVDGDVIMAGGTLDIQDKGIVGKNIRAASGEIHIDGVVKGNIQVFTGSLISNGTINGNVYADVGTFYLNGTIKGSAKVDARSIRLDQKAFVQGDFKYTSSEAIQKMPEAIIQGQQVNLPSEEAIPWYQDSYFWGKQIANAISYWLLALLFISLFPKLTARYSDIFGKNIFLNFLMGIVSIGALALASIFLAVTVVGIPLSLLLIIVTAISLWLAPLGVIFWLTRNIARQNWLENKRPWLIALMLLASTLILTILDSLPILGPIVHLLVVTAGLGALMITKWQVYRDAKNSL